MWFQWLWPNVNAKNNHKRNSFTIPADLDGGGGFFGFCRETETVLYFIVIHPTHFTTSILVLLEKSNKHTFKHVQAMIKSGSTVWAISIEGGGGVCGACFNPMFQIFNNTLYLLWWLLHHNIIVTWIEMFLSKPL